MKSFIVGAAALCACLGGVSAKADLIVSSTITAQQSGSFFDYTIVLTNSSASTVNLGTFWFAWIPGEDFLKTSPVSVTTPGGWGFQITHVPNVPTNGFAIQWVAGAPGAFNAANAITPGSSLTFGFRSTDTPAEIFGNSVFYPGTPVLTSFVYQGAPFSGAAVPFVVGAVPEPSSIVMAALGVGGTMIGFRRRIARRPAA